jgi:hypothetical protein
VNPKDYSRSEIRVDLEKEILDAEKRVMESSWEDILATYKEKVMPKFET